MLRPVHVVIASDKFKDAIDARDACAAIARGVAAVLPEVSLDLIPMADGGEGTAMALAAADPAAQVVDAEICGPRPGMRVRGRVYFVGDGRTAVLDMADAAGLAQLPQHRRDPLRTTSFGVGELIRVAAQHRPSRILVGLGGSATCDGGLGAAQALGAAIRLKTGPLQRPAVGADLPNLRSVTFPQNAIDGIDLICLCDVDHPLYGARGSAETFGPQKGASPEQVQTLDGGLRRMAEVTGSDAIADEPGMGAAGGLGFGLHLAVGASLVPGAGIVADVSNLAERLAGATLCFTGEGGFDQTSLAGKATGEVGRRCGAAGVPCVVLAGEVEPGLSTAEAGMTHVRSILPGVVSRERAIEQTADLLAEAAAQTMRLFLAGTRPIAGRLPA